MANTDNPHGLAILRRHGGGPVETKWFTKLANFGTAIFKNDTVMQKAGDATSGAIIEPGLTTPGTTLPSGVSANYGAVSTLTSHMVYTDWDAVFEAQDNNDTDGFTAANNGLNGNIECNAGSTTTKLSGHELDESTFNTSGSRDVKLLGLFPDPTNAYGSWARVEVIFNQHRMGYGVAGV